MVVRKDRIYTLHVIDGITSDVKKSRKRQIEQITVNILSALVARTPLLFKIQLSTFLGKPARIAKARSHTVRACVTLDVIPRAHMFSSAHLHASNQLTLIFLKKISFSPLTWHNQYAQQGCPP